MENSPLFLCVSEQFAGSAATCSHHARRGGRAAGGARRTRAAAARDKRNLQLDEENSIYVSSYAVAASSAKS
jgi:hypothetical protein